jgi:hypothetical protein
MKQLAMRVPTATSKPKSGAFIGVPAKSLQLMGRGHYITFINISKESGRNDERGM